MINWLTELTVGEWTLITTVVVLGVTTIGVLATIRGNWTARSEAKRPVFSVETRPAPPKDNPTLFLSCSTGVLEYDLVAEILSIDKNEQGPAAIALLGIDAVPVDQSDAAPDVYKRYHLGKIKLGDTREYSVQPDAGITGRLDQAWLRLTATADGQSWQSTHAFRMEYGRR